MNTVDWLGFIGVFQILLAFVLNLLGKIDKEDLSFILLNLVGSSMACLASVFLTYLPFVLLEGVWSLASLIALINYKKKK